MSSGATGGDVYISVMTIISSVRQMVETPIYAINEGNLADLKLQYGGAAARAAWKAITALAVLGSASTPPSCGAASSLPRGR